MDEKEGGSCDFITRRVCSWKNVQYRDELETEVLNSNNKICVSGGWVVYNCRTDKAYSKSFLSNVLATLALPWFELMVLKIKRSLTMTIEIKQKHLGKSPCANKRYIILSVVSLSTSVWIKCKCLLYGCYFWIRNCI